MNSRQLFWTQRGWVKPKNEATHFPFWLTEEGVGAVMHARANCVQKKMNTQEAAGRVQAPVTAGPVTVLDPVGSF